MSSRPQLSIVSPVYGAPDCLGELVRRIGAAAAQVTPQFEIILVNDASPDDSWAILCELAKSEPRLRAVNLSRNFGQHVAIAAGLDRAEGDYVVVMDCDLQDLPEQIPALVARAREGFDIVFARRLDRRDGFFKVLGGRAFHGFLSWLSGTPYDPTTANFSCSTRQVIAEYRKLRERSRSFPLGLRWLGFRVGTLDVQHGERFSGKSSYTLGRMLALAAQSITMHSNRPLELSIRFGAAIALLAFLYSVVLVIRYFAFGIPVQGWATVVVSLYLLSGLIIVNLGILGLYVGRVFDETKGRPLYVVREDLNRAPAGRGAQPGA